MNPKLQARVNAVNKANAYANELHPRLVSVFKIGQKIEMANGPLLAKIQKQVDALRLPSLSTVSLQVYRHVSNYNLAYTVKTCEQVDGRAYYYETTIYVGTLHNGVLTKLYPWEPSQVDYTVEGVEAARQAYNIAKEAENAARSALFPFWEHDN